MTHRELLDALHLWLHREGGDQELAFACNHFDWKHLPHLTLTLPEAAALEALEGWHNGLEVFLIDACEDFHETFSEDACRLVDEQVVRLDGRVSFGNDDKYECGNVLPLRPLKR